MSNTAGMAIAYPSLNLTLTKSDETETKISGKSELWIAKLDGAMPVPPELREKVLLLLDFETKSVGLRVAQTSDYVWIKVNQIDSVTRILSATRHLYFERASFRYGDGTHGL